MASIGGQYRKLNLNNVKYYIIKIDIKKKKINLLKNIISYL